MTKLIALHLAGACGGYCAYLLHVPLAWMIGSLLVSAALAMTFNVERTPRATRALGQTIIGSAIALYLTQEAVIRIAQSWLPLILNALMAPLAGLLIAAMLIKFTKMSAPTAILSSVPGGPMEMAIVAEQHGGDPAPVALAQSLRIVAVVLIYPPVMLWGQPLSAPSPSAVPHIVPLGFLTILGIAAIAAQVAKRIGVINPYFLGPMMSIGILTAFNIHLSDMPSPLIGFGQVMLGTSLGTMFRRDQFRAGWRVTLISIISTAALLCCSVGVAWMLHHLFDMDLSMLLLATAPGGVAELAITARALGSDVSLVTTFHVVRISLVMIMIQFAYLIIRKLRDGA